MQSASCTHPHKQVQQYLGGDAFKRRVEALRAQKGNERGIVISAGGPYYLPQARGRERRALRHSQPAASAAHCTPPLLPPAVPISWI